MHFFVMSLLPKGVGVGIFFPKDYLGMVSLAYLLFGLLGLRRWRVNVDRYIVVKEYRLKATSPTDSNIKPEIRGYTISMLFCSDSEKWIRTFPN